MQPKTGMELLEVMEELSNPIGTFFNDVLTLDVSGEVDKDDLFVVFKHWAHKKGINPGTDLAFKRRFLAATQDKPISTDLSRVGGERRNVYRGIRLTQKAQDYINSLGDVSGDIF